MFRLALLLCWLYIGSGSLCAQSIPELSVNQFVTQIDKKTSSIEKSLQKANTKMLAKINKRVRKAGDSSLVCRIDSILRIANNPVKRYLGVLDSLSCALKFLPSTNKTSQALKRIQSLNSEFEKYNQLTENVQHLKLFLQKELAGKTNLTRYIKALNKDAYYYSDKVKAYQTLLKDKKKLTREVLSVLSKQPKFKSFFQQHSQLSVLLGNNTVTPANPELQTRAMVEQLIAQRLGSGSVNVQNRLDAAGTELSEIRQHTSSLLEKKSDGQMPDFKPNSQHNKSFLQRLELGYNISPMGSSGILPASTNLALAIGYRINDNSVIGIGGGYRLGFGKPFKDIKLSNEGVSVRSYVDIKFWKSYLISGGFEFNYMQSFANLVSINNLDIWQKSGLLGFSKKYKVGSKEAKIQILWDFLSYSQIPPSQPVLFRFGYNLK